MNEDDTFFLYRRTFCRRLEVKFEKRTTFKGMDAVQYQMDPNIFDSDLDNVNSSCFCKNNQCLPRGIGNVSPCYYSEYKVHSTLGDLTN